METKSRYEVISDLERQKRELILERDGLGDEQLARQKAIKDKQRAKSDMVTRYDRELEDLQTDLKNFEKTMDNRKETIKELIRSVDESLKRFNQISQKKE